MFYSTNWKWYNSGNILQVATQTGWTQQGTLSQRCKGNVQTACGPKSPLVYLVLFSSPVSFALSLTHVQCTAGLTTVPRAVCATLDSLSTHFSKWVKSNGQIFPIVRRFCHGTKDVVEHCQTSSQKWLLWFLAFNGPARHIVFCLPVGVLVKCIQNIHLYMVQLTYVKDTHF